MQRTAAPLCLTLMLTGVYTTVASAAPQTNTVNPNSPTTASDSKAAVARIDSATPTVGSSKSTPTQSATVPAKPASDSSAGKPKAPPPIADNQSIESTFLPPATGTRPKRPWKRHDNEFQGTALRLIGIRGTTSLTRTTPDQQNSTENSPTYSIGAAITERGIGYLSYGILTTRYLDFLEIGADSEGWLYRAEGQLALGPRWRWTEETSGILRLGAHAHIAKAAGTFSSDIRTPQLQIGLQHNSSIFEFEFAVEGATNLKGYLRPPKESESLKGTRTGALLLSLTIDELRLDAEATRFWRDRETVASEARAWGCGKLGQAYLCLNGRYLRLPRNSSRTSYSGVFGGISLMIGQSEWLHSD